MRTPVTRRQFLGTAGAGLFVASTAAQLRVPDPPGRKLGYALVGLGSLAINQLMPAFAKCEKSKLTAFVSGSPGKARTLAERYGVPAKNIYDYANYDAIRDNPDVDIIYIVLPNSMHAEYTIRGAKAGKHVLCEKPMANTPEDCRQMIEACRNAQRKLMIGYRLRYEPYNQQLIKFARGQELGPLKVVLADAGFNIGDPTQWRLNRTLAGGGSLMDIGIYALQAARYLTGAEPSEVHAMMYSTPDDPRFREVEETVTFQLRFPGGVLANCTSSYGASLNRFRIVGPQGWAELEPALSYSGLRMRVGGSGRVEERILPVVDHFAAEMDHFSECIVKDTEPLTPGEEGLRDLTIMMAIYESANSGKAITL